MGYSQISHIDEAKILKHKMREKYHLTLLKGNSKHIKNNM